MPTTTKKIKPAGLELMELAPVTWNAMATGKTGGELGEIVRFLDGVAERAARMSAYLGLRGGYYCGDRGHASAVKQSNRAARKVRKALGYNVTHDVTF